MPLKRENQFAKTVQTICQRWRSTSSKKRKKNNERSASKKAFSALRRQGILAAVERQEDLSLYQYRNKINGVVFQRKKYRFRTLGIDMKNIQKQVKLQQLNEKGKVLKQKELSVLQPKR